MVASVHLDCDRVDNVACMGGRWVEAGGRPRKGKWPGHGKGGARGSDAERTPVTGRPSVGDCEGVASAQVGLVEVLSMATAMAGVMVAVAVAGQTEVALLERFDALDVAPKIASPVRAHSLLPTEKNGAAVVEEAYHVVEGACL